MTILNQILPVDLVVSADVKKLDLVLSDDHEQADAI
jgi:hypothetical protein